MTQRECARRLGIHTSTWQQYEFGNIPKGEVLQRIHSEFHIDLNWLLPGQGRAYTGPEPESKYAAQRPLLEKKPQPAEGKGSSRRKGGSIHSVNMNTVSRAELVLVRSLRICGDEYQKRVHAAVSIRARNILEERTLEPTKGSEVREDLELLSLSSIE